MERTISTQQRCLLLGVIQYNLCEKWDTDFPVPSEFLMKNSVFLHFCCPESCWLDGFDMQSSCSKSGFKEEVEQSGLSLLQGHQCPKSQTPGSAQSAHGVGLLDHGHKSLLTVGTEMPWEMKGESSHLDKSKTPAGFTSLCFYVSFWDRSFLRKATENPGKGFQPLTYLIYIYQPVLSLLTEPTFHNSTHNLRTFDIWICDAP